MSPSRIVVIGGSAGSLEALRALITEIPADFAAAILVVIHTAPQATSVLPQILNRLNTIPASYPFDGQRIQDGRIYVARPDQHLEIRDGVMRLTRAPRENRARPSIDVLFRSAARMGNQVMGVLLSGTMDDGVMGLTQISLNGGMSIVQEPSEALFPNLPDSAIKKDHVDLKLPAEEIGVWLAQNAFKEQKKVVTMQPREQNEPSKLQVGCPSCGGVLQLTNEHLGRFRCMIGHTFGTETLLEEQVDAIEAALWSAYRALEERQIILKRISARLSSNIAIERIEEQIANCDAQRKIIREVIEVGLLRTSNQTAPETQTHMQKSEHEEAG